MKRFTLVAAAVLAFVIAAVGALLAQSPTAIAVVRDPGCGCCLSWVAHLKKAGYQATVTESSSMAAVKDSKGVPAGARSCHTGTIGG